MQENQPVESQNENELLETLSQMKKLLKNNSKNQLIKLVIELYAQSERLRYMCDQLLQQNKDLLKEEQKEEV